MSDAIILRRRQELLNKLRPLAKAEVGHAMNEPLPYFHTVGKGKPRIRRSRSPAIRRPDESHKTRPSYPAAARPPPPIAMGAAIIGQDVMQMNAEIAQGVLLAGGAQAVGQRVGRPRRALRRSSGY